MNTRPVALAAALLTTFTIAACTDRDQGMSEAEAPQDRTLADTLSEAARDTAGTLTVVLDEWTVRPARDTIDAGPTTFRARNNGSYDHILEVEGQGEEWMTDTVPPGEWADLTTDLVAGTYELYCPIEGDEQTHEELGMSTRLVVVDRQNP